MRIELTLLGSSPQSFHAVAKWFWGSLQNEEDSGQGGRNKQQEVQDHLD